MNKEYNQKVAEKIIALFNVADLDTHKLDGIAFWVRYLASVPIMAKIIYFCERVLDRE